MRMRALMPKSSIYKKVVHSVFSTVGAPIDMYDEGEDIVSNDSYGGSGDEDANALVNTLENGLDILDNLNVTKGGGGECWWACPDATGLVPIEGTVNKIQWGAFLRSVCIRIGDYAHAGCRVTNAFKKRLTEPISTLTVGVVGVRRMPVGLPIYGLPL